jgi:hypothetical protein
MYSAGTLPYNVMNGSIHLSLGVDSKESNCCNVINKLYRLTQAHMYAEIEFEFAHVLEGNIKDLHEGISVTIRVTISVTKCNRKRIIAWW